MLNKMSINHWISLPEHTVLFRVNFHINSSLYFMMMPRSKGQKAVHAYMIRLLNLGSAKHEKVAIYVVNQRISNVCRIAELLRYL